MKKHANLSIFVPHIGCPRRCIFCDQNSISGMQFAPSGEYVSLLCDKYLPESGAGKTEIAFFGGSFTAIKREYMLELLDAAKPFVESGRANGIRLSTRPDAIDDEVLSILSDYGITAIELGAQSMDDKVLRLNRRGHIAADTEAAARLIKERGFSLGLQMMLGMYGESDPFYSAQHAADTFIKLKADTVRIYPTLVIENTPLFELWKRGDYVPLSLDDAVEITAGLLLKFGDASIDVIRVGLHSDMSLQNSFAAGPFHPAFGELCISRLLMKKLMPLLDGRKEVTIAVSKGMMSAMIGQKRANLTALSELGVSARIVEDESLSRYDIKLL